LSALNIVRALSRSYEPSDWADAGSVAPRKRQHSAAARKTLAASADRAFVSSFKIQFLSVFL
jgi:hypothetical protein